MTKIKREDVERPQLKFRTKHFVLILLFAIFVVSAVIVKSLITDILTADTRQISESETYVNGLL